MNFEKIWRKYSCRQFINDEETGERIMYKNGFNKVIEESFPHEKQVIKESVSPANEEFCYRTTEAIKIMEQVLELLDKMQLERENTEYKQPLIKAIELTMIKCLRMEIEKLESIPHERVVKPTLAEMDKMWINYVDNTLQIEFEELMKKHNKCVKGRKGVPREVSDYLASYYNDLIEINNSKCSL